MAIWQVAQNNFLRSGDHFSKDAKTFRAQKAVLFAECLQTDIRFLLNVKVKSYVFEILTAGLRP